MVSGFVANGNNYRRNHSEKSPSNYGDIEPSQPANVNNR